MRTAALERSRAADSSCAAASRDGASPASTRRRATPRLAHRCHPPGPPPVPSARVRLLKGDPSRPAGGAAPGGRSRRCGALRPGSPSYVRRRSRSYAARAASGSYLVREGAARPGVGNAKPRRDGGGHVREGVPGSQMDAGADGPSPDEEGGVLPGMIGAGRGGIAAVVAHEQKGIVGAQGPLNLGEPAVESLEGRRVALGVVAVPPEGVE